MIQGILSQYCLLFFITTMLIKVLCTDHLWCFDLNARFRQQNDTSTLDLYWPDGTSKRSKSHAKQKGHDQMRQMAQALVDKYNEDHHLLGVCSLPLPPSAYWGVPVSCCLVFLFMELLLTWSILVLVSRIWTQRCFEVQLNFWAPVMLLSSQFQYKF